MCSARREHVEYHSWKQRNAKSFCHPNSGKGRGSSFCTYYIGTKASGGGLTSPLFFVRSLTTASLSKGCLSSPTFTTIRTFPSPRNLLPPTPSRTFGQPSGFLLSRRVHGPFFEKDEKRTKKESKKNGKRTQLRHIVGTA